MRAPRRSEDAMIAAISPRRQWHAACSIAVMLTPRPFANLSLVVSAGVILIAAAARAAAAPLDDAERITATAHVKSAAGVDASAPLTIVIDRFATDAERDALVAAVTHGGTEAARKLLASRPSIGWVEAGAVRVQVQYAYARPLGDGRLITVVTAAPIAFIGAGLPGAPSTAGFDLGLVFLEVNRGGSGGGELVPAAKVRINADGALVTDDYGAEVVKLSKVSGK